MNRRTPIVRPNSSQTSRPHRTTRGAAVLLAQLLLLILTSAAAPAQPASDPDPVPPDADPSTTFPSAARSALDSDKPQLFIEFGWSGRVEPDAWTPVLISVQGGLDPFSGAVVIEHPQDATQSSSITVPITATPGRITRTTAALCLPMQCERITARLVDTRGRIIQQLNFAQAPSSVQLPMPDFVSAYEPVTAAVAATRGAASPDNAGSAAATIGLIEQPRIVGASGRYRLGPARSRLVAAADLPMTWAPYEGLSILAVDAEAAAAADPRSIAAIREWVTGGGRLVVIAAAPGPAWRTWLPPTNSPSPIGPFVTLDDSTRGPIPPELAAVLQRTHRDFAEDTNPSAAYTSPTTPGSSTEVPGVYGPFRPGATLSERPAPPPEEVEPATPTVSPVVPAPSIQQRVFRLTPHGEACGWRIRWRADAPSPDAPWVEPPSTATTAGAAGLLAEGPVGLGWVTLIGIDPRRVASAPNDLATRDVWDNITAISLADRRILAEAAAGSRWGRWYSMTDGSEARLVVLNALADAPGAGRSAFFAIAAAMAALALLMGPFDAVVLRRLRARHRSWLTALLWIALATLAAYMAPALTRSTATTVSRLSAVDVVVPPSAPPPNSTADQAGSPESPAAIAWQSSITGLFAGQSLRAALTAVPPPGVGAPPGARWNPPATWWRGFSAIQMYEASQQRLGSAVQSAQLLPDLGSLEARADPWGGWGVERPGSVSIDNTPAPPPGDPVPIPGGNTMMPTALRTWTFRAMEDHARVAPPCTARLVGEAGDRIVTLSGLPPGAKVAAAACRIGDDWHELTFAPGQSAAPTDAPLSAPLGPALRTPPLAWQLPIFRPHEPWSRAQRLNSVRQNPMIALAMPGSERRALSLRTLAESGRWATVYLHLEDMPADVALTGMRPGKRTVVCRILTPIPLTPVHAPPPAPPGDPR